MERVSEQHLEFLKNAHGNIAGIAQALGAVTENQYIPSQDLVDALQSLPHDVAYPDGSLPNGYIFGSAKIHAENDVPYQKYTQQLVETQDRFVTIGDTRGSQLIERTQFEGLLEDALIEEGSTLDANKVLHGYMEDGVRQPGLWDDISRGFAENARGDVVTVTPHADANRVFVQTELPALLDNADVERINGLPRQVYVDRLAEIAQGLPDGAPMADAYTQLNRNFVQHTSEAYMARFSPLGFARDMDAPHLDRDFIRAHEDLKPVLDTMEPPKASMFQTVFNTASDVLKPVGKVAVNYGGPVMLFMGLGMDSAEASELGGKINEAVQNGALPPEAVDDYQALMYGHVGKNFDPTPLTEIGVQVAYAQWADKYDVDPSLREALRPSSLVYDVADASMDIAFYSAEQTVDGAAYAYDNTTRGLDHVADSVTGDLDARQRLYDSLPSVDVRDATARELTGVHVVLNAREDVMPLIELKARAEYFEAQAATANDPDQAAYFVEKAQDTHDAFEMSVNGMDADERVGLQNALDIYNQHIEADAGAAEQTAGTPDEQALVASAAMGEQAASPAVFARP